MAIADKLTVLQVKSAIIADSRVGMYDIEVEAHDGVVVLTGDVETEEQKQSAEEVAYTVENVVEVQNDIQVVPHPDQQGVMSAGESHFAYGPVEGNVGGTVFSLGSDYTTPSSGVPASEQFPGQFSDDEIEAEVRQKLDSQDRMDASGVRASSQNQIVYLKGSVKSEEDINELQDIVLQVRGVMGINSELSIADAGAGEQSI